MNKSRLHKLVDELPEHRIPQAEVCLESISRHNGIKEFLASVPEDSERLTSEEEASLREAEADIAANGTVPHDEVRKMLGL